MKSTDERKNRPSPTTDKPATQTQIPPLVERFLIGSEEGRPSQPNRAANRAIGRLRGGVSAVRYGYDHQDARSFARRGPF